MTQINFTTASPQELRQLLDSSRRRGDAALSYKILEEMAARRGKGKRPTTPRHVDVHFDDPLDAPEDDIPPMPAIRFPANACVGEQASAATVLPFAAVAEQASPERARPELESEAADLDLRLPPRERPRRPPPPRLPFLVAAGFVLGVGLGVAAGWGAAVFLHEPEAVATPAASPVETAALAPPAPLPVVAEPAPEPVDEAAPPEAAEETVEATSEALELPTPPPAPNAVRADSACASEPTSADRAICGDAHLRRLQAELRQAYNEALQAHEERGLLRQRQLAWREARNTVTDPDRLAALYEARIRRLKAATAEARSLH